MAIGSSVPPRAYPREILTTAFNWLQSQPDSVRTKATTPDALVGLYMQAQRGGLPAPGFDAEAPVSSQAFMSDLKNLAKGLEEFDDSRPARAVAPPASLRAQLGQTSTYPQSAQASMPMQAPAATPSPVNAVGPATYFQKPIPPEDFSFEPDVPVRRPQPAVSAAPGLLGDVAALLNERSIQMLREVQLALNLTSEVEAVNLMIAIAHKNLKSLLA
jgi:hypothetical protein